MLKTLNYCFFLFKEIFSPIRTLISYSHVTLIGRVIITKSRISKNVKIYDNTRISNSIIGEFSYIGGDCTIMNCTIGKFCSIAPNVKIGLGIHPVDLVSTYPGFYSNKASGSYFFNHNAKIEEYKDVEIGNDVWIGNGAMIMDGVNIGDGAIIAAGAIVTKNVNNFSIVGGMPAKVIKNRFSDEICKKLQKIEWWNWPKSKIKNNSDLFSDINNFLNNEK
jgi:acetyltransferase-like isoleucine patch superfamily enzyme